MQKVLIDNLVVVRGGGDIATGTIYKLYKAGFKVLILETDHPSAIRRYVAFSEAVYEGKSKVEDVTCYLAKDIENVIELLKEGKLTILVDSKGKSINILKPKVVVDAILAKKNLGTNKNMALHTIAIGPGFTAGVDVDVVVETKRGHNLGRIIYEGTAFPNTGIPGVIAGYSKERVIHAEAEGILRNVVKISDIVNQGDIIANIETEYGLVPVKATIKGVLRGLIRDGYPVTKGFKIADIDPRIEEKDNCFTISDKARCIAGGVLEAILYLDAQRRI